MATIPVPGTVVQVGSQVSPSGDTGTGGPAGPAPNQGIVIGGTVAEPNFPGGVIVPSFKGHPDAIWTPMGAFDDHFDGASLDPKWVVTGPTAGLITSLPIELVGSVLSMGGLAPSADAATVYSYNINQLLPNANNFELTLKLDGIVLALNPTGTNNSVATLTANLENSAGNNGVRVIEQAYAVPAAAINQVRSVMCSTNLNTTWHNGLGSSGPMYIKFKYDSAAFTTQVFYSANGRSWLAFPTIGQASSGFNTNPPARFRLGIQSQRNGFALLHCDWVKFVNV
jgi:hypothetical protein